MRHKNLTSDGLPSSIEAERLILGSMLMDEELLAAAIGALEPSDFSMGKHEVIFQMAAKMFGNGQHVDTVTVGNALNIANQLETIDGVSYLISLQDGLPRLPKIDSYLSIVRAKSILRRAIYAHREAIAQCMDEAGEPSELLARAEHSLSELQQRISDNGEFETPIEIIQGAGGIGAYLDRRRKDGVLTGIAGLNALTRGFQPGSLNIIAAVTSRGKTALALNFAAHAAAHKIGIAMFSLEMTKQEITDRLLTIETGVPLREMSLPINSVKVRNALNLINSMVLEIRDRSVTVPAIHAKVRRLKSKGIGMVIVDYLQLVSPAGRYENRTQEVSSISRSLKLAAVDLNVPVIALSQLKRLDGNRKPVLQDLRESGSIEQDANTVTFIHSEENYSEVDPAIPINAWLLLAKQRNGPLGEVPVQFHRNIGRFQES